MTKPAGGERRPRLHFRREAYAALNGRVPVLLAIAIALVSGGLLGYTWRMLTSEPVVVRVSAPCPPPSPALFFLPWLPSAPSKARLILIGEKSATIVVDPEPAEVPASPPAAKDPPTPAAAK